MHMHGHVCAHMAEYMILSQADSAGPRPAEEIICLELVPASTSRPDLFNSQ